MVDGRKSPRGAKTYVAESAFVGSAGDVKEVVFRRSVKLPHSTEVAESYNGPWQPFWEP